MTIFPSSVPTQLVPTISLQAISVTFPAFGSKPKLFLRASFSILSPLTYFHADRFRASMSVVLRTAQRKAAAESRIIRHGSRARYNYDCSLEQARRVLPSNASFQRQRENHRALRRPWTALPFCLGQTPRCNLPFNGRRSHGFPTAIRSSVVRRIHLPLSGPAQILCLCGETP